jgi:hypothetical protein
VVVAANVQEHGKIGGLIVERAAPDLARLGNARLRLARPVAKEVAGRSARILSSIERNHTTKDHLPGGNQSPRRSAAQSADIVS